MLGHERTGVALQTRGKPIRPAGIRVGRYRAIEEVGYLAFVATICESIHSVHCLAQFIGREPGGARLRAN